MFNWLKSKFTKNYVQPVAWTVWYQTYHTSPWITFKVAGVPVMVRTKKEAKEIRRRLNGEGYWDTKISPVRSSE